MHRPSRNHPDDALAAQVLTNQGRCFFHLGRHTEEFAAYVAALQHDPQRWQALVAWAATEVRRGNAIHARDLLLQAIHMTPTLAHQLAQTYALAYAYEQLGDYPAVVQWAEQTLQADPVHQNALRLLVRALSHLWRDDLAYAPRAIDVYHHWLADYLDDLFVVKELYLVYRHQGAGTAARQVVDATRLTPDAPIAALYYYASMLADEGLVVEAITTLEQARALLPERYVLHLLGHLREQQGEYLAAIALYADLLPDHEYDQLKHIADCYHYARAEAATVPLCLRLVILQPQEQRWWGNLTVALVAGGDIATATQVQQVSATVTAGTLSLNDGVQGVTDVLTAAYGPAMRRRCQCPWTRADIR